MIPEPHSKLYAHSRPAPHKEETWEPLEKHLDDVARLAARFAEPFGGQDAAWIAGLLHDLGKAKPGFQDYLRGLRGSEPHAAAGAKLCEARYGEHLGRLLAYCIAGHHAGLANGVNRGNKLTPLSERLHSEPTPFVPNWLAIPDTPTTPPKPFANSWTNARDEKEFATAFFTRMLFSCLVDADFLATEAFYAEASERPVERGWSGSLNTLKERLDAWMARFGPPESDVDRIRAEVLSAARRRAAEEPGLFSLTVPTGGGKTLSSLSFAIDHALKHGLRRIIYVIPFTSIIEQTAAVFRNVLEDDDAVLEHHSSFDWDALGAQAADDDDEGPDGLEKLRLAAQNWDRPIVVTTAVQFFESLFSNRSSRTRKLHNLAQSVIILDEAQTLPLKLMRPCLAALRELARGYGSSVVLCTATQPAILREDGFKPAEALSRTCGVLPVREIAPDPTRLYQNLRRVRVSNIGNVGDLELLKHLQAHEQVLCIVNNRAHAREAFASLRGEGCAGATHLSTTMTAAHRRAVLSRVRKDLLAGAPVRLVSTSLIEAGVDVSFPVVFRAVAGIDSIAQAAGRCNRNGELGPDGGRLFVFDPETGPNRSPPRELKQFADTAQSVMKNHPDPLTLEAVKAYFNELFWRRGEAQLDAADVGPQKGVMLAVRQAHGRLDYPFESIADGFRLIETTMAPIIVPATTTTAYGAPAHLIETLRTTDRPGAIARKLQQFLVNIPAKAHAALIKAGAAEVIREPDFGLQFVILSNTDLYDASSGLDWGDPTFRASESLVI
jgi:CRISPR-associated endonuclease/helicase Cas3